MTVRVEKQTDSASIAEESPSQLPAYSETDGQSNAGFEMVDGPDSPSQPTHMTAEQEKAYLALRDQPGAREDLHSDIRAQPSEESKEQYQSHEQTRDDDTTASTLARGLQVPSCRGKVSSGFPYPDMLGAYGVSSQEWSTFTSEITQAARLTNKDWTITVGASVATFCASGIFIGWLGLIPAFVVGHHVRRSTEHRNLRAARDTGDLEAKLLRWNETIFAPRGFLVRLDLPGDEASDLDRMDVYTPRKWGRKCGGRCGHGVSGRHEGRWAQKAEMRAQCAKKKTAKKGRIVIVPINGGSRPTTKSLIQLGDTLDQNPFADSEKGLHAATVREL
jgi:Domain of unknown function (DUF4646)